MDDLKNIAPKLSNIKKDNLRSIPDHYFEDFYARVEGRLHSDGETIRKSNAFMRVLKPTLGLAASFTVIFMLVYWPLSKFDINSFAQNDIILEESTIDEYSTIIGELDESSLYALLENDIEEDNFSDDDLIGYISTSFNEYELSLESN